jgi:hypothetical protein
LKEVCLGRAMELRSRSPLAKFSLLLLSLSSSFDCLYLLRSLYPLSGAKLALERDVTLKQDAEEATGARSRREREGRGKRERGRTLKGAAKEKKTLDDKYAKRTLSIPLLPELDGRSHGSGLRRLFSAR